MPDNDISFKPLCVADLPLLCDWLNRPHMREYYQKEPVSLPEVERKFLPRILGQSPTYDHIAYHAGKPFGKLQCYRNVDHPPLPPDRFEESKAYASFRRKPESRAMMREVPTFVGTTIHVQRIFKFCQVTSHPPYANEIHLTVGISIDLFIAEPEMMGKGLGKRMLRTYVSEIAFPLHPAETRCFICHERTHLRARACSVCAGFQPLRQVTENGIACELLVLER